MITETGKNPTRKMLDALTDEAPFVEYTPDAKPAERCRTCRGKGVEFFRLPSRQRTTRTCKKCRGIGFFGINPKKAMRCSIQGSDFKQAMLTARFIAGVALWNPLDQEGE